MKSVHLLHSVLGGSHTAVGSHCPLQAILQVCNLRGGALHPSHAMTKWHTVAFIVNMHASSGDSPQCHGIGEPVTLKDAGSPTRRHSRPTADARARSHTHHTRTHARTYTHSHTHTHTHTHTHIQTRTRTPKHALTYFCLLLHLRRGKFSLQLGHPVFLLSLIHI